MDSFIRDFKYFQYDTSYLDDLLCYKSLLNCNLNYFSLFHNNICSVHKNFDQLLVYLSIVDFDCICLSETYNIQNYGNFNIANNYKIYYNNSALNKNDSFIC